jgi:hypothetical protein
VAKWVNGTLSELGKVIGEAVEAFMTAFKFFLDMIAMVIKEKEAKSE